MDLAALIKFQQLYYNICGSAHNQCVHSAVCWRWIKLLKTQGKITCSWCNQKPKLSFLAFFYPFLSKMRKAAANIALDLIVKFCNNSYKFIRTYKQILQVYVPLQCSSYFSLHETGTDMGPGCKQRFFLLIYSRCPFYRGTPPPPCLKLFVLILSQYAVTSCQHDCIFRRNLLFMLILYAEWPSTSGGWPSKASSLFLTSSILRIWLQRLLSGTLYQTWRVGARSEL